MKSRGGPHLRKSRICNDRSLFLPMSLLREAQKPRCAAVVVAGVFEKTHWICPLLQFKIYHNPRHRTGGSISLQADRVGLPFYGFPSGQFERPSEPWQHRFVNANPPSRLDCGLEPSAYLIHEAPGLPGPVELFDFIICTPFTPLLSIITCVLR